MSKTCVLCNIKPVVNPHWNATKCENCRNLRTVKSCYVCGIDITSTNKHKYCTDCKEKLRYKPNYCIDCGICISRSRASSSAKRCLPCVECDLKYKASGNRARGCHSIVAIAVRYGILPKLDGVIQCVDCGGVASQYEHRDYMKPLDVDPVCRKCNAERGSAINCNNLNLLPQQFDGITGAALRLNIRLEYPEDLK